MRLPEIVDKKQNRKLVKEKKPSHDRQTVRRRRREQRKDFLFKDPKNNCNLKVVKSFILNALFVIVHISSVSVVVLLSHIFAPSRQHYSVTIAERKEREREKFRNKCYASVCLRQPKEDTKRKQEKETKLLSLVTQTFKTLSLAILCSIFGILSA